MAILDADKKEVKIGDRVAYVKRSHMEICFGKVASFTPKSVKLECGSTRLPWQFIVIGG